MLDDSHLNARPSPKGISTQDLGPDEVAKTIIDRRVTVPSDQQLYREKRFLVTYYDHAAEEGDVLGRTLSFREKKLLEQVFKWLRLEETDFAISFKELEEE